MAEEKKFSPASSTTASLASQPDATPGEPQGGAATSSSVGSGAGAGGTGGALPFAPWKTLYSGAWSGHKTSVFVNEERVLLLLVQDDAAPQSALVLMKRVFVVDGSGGSRELVEFLNSQKRAFTVVEKIGRAGRYRFIVLEGEPTYVANLARDFANVLKSQYFFLSGTGKALKEVAESYRTSVSDLKDASFDVADALLGDPLTLIETKPPEGGAGGAGAGDSRESGERASGRKQKTLVNAFFGLTSARESFQTPFDSLRRVTVFGKDAAFASKIQQVLCEAALLNNASVLVFSSTNALRGLAEPAGERTDYDYYGMQGEPHGFPLKEFSTSTLRIDLSEIDADDFLTALALDKTDFADAITAAFDAAESKNKGGARDLVALMEALDEVDAELFPLAVRSRALRVLECLEREFPHAFGENKPPLFCDALRVARDRSLASVLWLDCAGVPPALKQLYYCFASGAVARVFESEDASVDFLCVVDEDASLVGDAARSALARASEVGVGFCVRGEFAADLQSVHSTLAFELVGADAFASTNGSKTKFLPRPTYSKDAAKDFAKPGFFGARIAAAAQQNGVAASRESQSQPAAVKQKQVQVKAAVEAGAGAPPWVNRAAKQQAQAPSGAPAGTPPSAAPSAPPKPKKKGFKLF